MLKQPSTLTCRVSHLSPFYHQLWTLFFFLSAKKQLIHSFVLLQEQLNITKHTGIYRKALLHRNTKLIYPLSTQQSALILLTARQCRFKYNATPDCNDETVYLLYQVTECNQQNKHFFITALIS